MQNDNRGKILDQESMRCLRFEVVVQQEKDGAARPRGEWRGRGPRPRRRARSRSPAAEASERRAGKPAAAGRTERGPRSRWGSGPAGETPAKGERTRPQPLSEPAFREVGMGARPRMERSLVEMGPRGDMAPELCTHRVNKSLALIGLL